MSRMEAADTGHVQRKVPQTGEKHKAGTWGAQAGSPERLLWGQGGGCFVCDGPEAPGAHSATRGNIWISPSVVKTAGLLCHLELGIPGPVTAPVPARTPPSPSSSAKWSHDPCLTGLLPWLHEQTFLVLWAVIPVGGCYLHGYGMCMCLCVVDLKNNNSITCLMLIYIPTKQ